MHSSQTDLDDVAAAREGGTTWEKGVLRAEVALLRFCRKILFSPDSVPGAVSS